MSTSAPRPPDDYFDRISDRVDLPLLHGKLVVIVGVGTVGSQMARELANSGVGRLRMMDGDPLEVPNLVRHALPRDYVGMNKAEGMTLYLASEIPGVNPEAVPRYVDESMSDAQLDELLVDADLIIAATDDREAQRRVGRRALALDIPAIFPALHANNSAEVVVQRSPRFPCFFCRDGFRRPDERLREVTALNADTLALIQLATHLSLGILDRSSAYANLLEPQPGRGVPQLYVQNRFALAIQPLSRRPNCPSCGVGPSPLVPALADERDGEPVASAQFDWLTDGPVGSRSRPATTPSVTPSPVISYGDSLFGKGLLALLVGVSGLGSVILFFPAMAVVVAFLVNGTSVLHESMTTYAFLWVVSVVVFVTSSRGLRDSLD